MGLGITSSNPPDVGRPRRRANRFAVVPRFLRCLGLFALLCLLALLPQALRLAIGRRRQRGAPAPKSGSPGWQPGASDNPTSDAGEAMTMLSQAAPSRRAAISPAQYSALLRWHPDKTQLDVLRTLREAPRFPLIDTGGQPSRRSRYRGPRQPRGGGNHAA